MKSRRPSPPPCSVEEHGRRRAKPNPGHIVFDTAATIFSAVGDPARLELLLQLSARPMTIGELALAVGRSKSLVSQQLRVLRIVHLARGVRRGNLVHYEVHDKRAERLISAFIVRVLAQKTVKATRTRRSR